MKRRRDSLGFNILMVAQAWLRLAALVLRKGIRLLIRAVINERRGAGPQPARTASGLSVRRPTHNLSAPPKAPAAMNFVTTPTQQWPATLPATEPDRL